MRIERCAIPNRATLLVRGGEGELSLWNVNPGWLVPRNPGLFSFAPLEHQSGFAKVPFPFFDERRELLPLNRKRLKQFINLPAAVREFVDLHADFVEQRQVKIRQRSRLGVFD